jgi:succinyl-diaminopimelate desuccinylase
MMATEVNAPELTRKSLSFNTITPPGREQPCARSLGKLLEDGGFKVAYLGVIGDGFRSFIQSLK